MNVTMDLRERVGHMLVLGTTRVGKTRLAEVLITQDIRRGNITIVFDPKGDADLLRRMWAEAHRAGRSEEFYVFHLGWPDISARYNAIGRFGRVSEVAGRVAGQLSGEGTARRSGSLPGGLLISLPGHWLLWGSVRIMPKFYVMSPISGNSIRHIRCR